MHKLNLHWTALVFLFAFIFAIGVVPPLAHAQTAQSQEPWKGASPQTDGTLTVMPGMSINGTDVELAIVGAAAKRIIERGFVPDINDQVFLEVMLGPSITGDFTAWFYGVNLRWDFHYNEDWGIYGLGGLGGVIVDANVGNDTSVHPRFGVGYLKALGSSMKFRAEAQSDFVGAGLMFLF
jgi:opacity protein-like surface antigen